MIRQPTIPPIPKIQIPQIRIPAFRFHIENGKLVCTVYKGGGFTGQLFKGVDEEMAIYTKRTTEVPKIKVIRRWDMEGIMHMCINHNFYTRGDTRAYTKMLDYVKQKEPTPEEIYIVAVDILDHTDENEDQNSCIYSYSSFIRMLKNPLYKGMYRDDPQFCDPLIDPDRFDHIQTLIKKNVRQRRSGTQFIFSGLLTCDVCGRSIAGYTTGRRRKDGSITRKPRYRCTAWNMNRSCTNNKSWMEEVLEDRVLTLVRPSLSAYIADYDVEDGGGHGRNPAADAARIRTKLKKLYDLFMDDLIDRDLYKSEYDQLNGQLQEALAAADHPRKDVSELKKFLSQPWEDVYRDFSVQEKNAFWKSFVDTIRIREDGSIADIIFL